VYIKKKHLDIYDAYKKGEISYDTAATQLGDLQRHQRISVDNRTYTEADGELCQEHCR
jgi:hypothetical protein